MSIRRPGPWLDEPPPRAHAARRGRGRPVARGSTRPRRPRPGPPAAQNHHSSASIPSDSVGRAPILAAMTLCFIEPAEAIRVIAESVGREARRALLSAVIEAWVDDIPEQELAQHYAQAVSDLDHEDLSMLAAWHATLEVGTPVASAEFLVGRVRGARRAQARGAQAGGALPRRRGVPRRRRRGGGARHRAAVALGGAARAALRRRRSRSTSHDRIGGEN